MIFQRGGLEGFTSNRISSHPFFVLRNKASKNILAGAGGGGGGGGWG